MAGLFVAFCALNTLDFALTRRILAEHGQERNPFMRWAYQRAGMPGMAAAKFATTVVLALLWAFNALSVPALAVADAAYLGVIANNFLQLKPAGK